MPYFKIGAQIPHPFAAGRFIAESLMSLNLRCMEKGSVIKRPDKITDTIWLYPAYHVRTYHGKVWPVVIIIAHR